MKKYQLKNIAKKALQEQSTNVPGLNVDSCPCTHYNPSYGCLVTPSTQDIVLLPIGVSAFQYANSVNPITGASIGVQPVVGDKFCSDISNNAMYSNNTGTTADCPGGSTSIVVSVNGPSIGSIGNVNPKYNINNSEPCQMGCGANTSYSTWPSGYFPAFPSNPGQGGSMFFTWYGNTITLPNGTTVSNGQQISNSFLNLVLANQSSYCEWCSDFYQSGGSNLSGFQTWLPLWHDPDPTGGQSWTPSNVPGTPPHTHNCGCCPEYGGPSNVQNPTIQFSQKPIDNIGIDVDDEDKGKKDCCAWCATVDPNIPSKPPVGCEDFDCNNCPGFELTKPIKPEEPTISENLLKILKRRAGIKK